MNEAVKRRCRGAASVIHLARPDKANPMSSALVEQLHEALDAVLADGSRLVVFSGVGKHFSAGFDFSGYRDQSQGDLVMRFVRIEQLLQRIRYASCVSAAFVNGAAFGAGADLAAAKRHEDLGLVAGSLAKPGLHQRIAGYLAAGSHDRRT